MVRVVVEEEEKKEKKNRTRRVDSFIALSTFLFGLTHHVSQRVDRLVDGRDLRGGREDGEAQVVVPQLLRHRLRVDQRREPRNRLQLFFGNGEASGIERAAFCCRGGRVSE